MLHLDLRLRRSFVAVLVHRRGLSQLASLLSRSQYGQGQFRYGLCGGSVVRLILFFIFRRSPTVTTWWFSLRHLPEVELFRDLMDFRAPM